MVANHCKMIPEKIPDKWTFERFGECVPTDTPITFLEILLSVQFEAFLWGFGTAMGELPPYFMAKAAAASQKKLDDLEEISGLKGFNIF